MDVLGERCWFATSRMKNLVAQIDVVIVPHTHWDREWYHPFQVFRYRLVALIDRVLDLLAADPDFGPFTLDGQTIVLDDYLALRPQREAELRQHVQAGRLLIGPWYVLPDEFLVSGESTVRNLMLGYRICQRFGNRMTVGYVPDPFGHISQLPQILAQCGIDAAAFRRGLSDEPTELWWGAPDDTRLLTIYLRDGYDNAAHLPGDRDGFVNAIRGHIASLLPHSLTPHLLLMNGGDHMPPRSDLAGLIRAANEQLSDSRIRVGTLSQFVASVRQSLNLDASPQVPLPVVRGELRSPKRHYLLPGVLSTRMWIKQHNNAGEIELVSYAEPLAAISRLLGGRDVREELWQAWRYLMENHPHDSICGCSVDQVHEEMKTRFAWSAQIAEAVATEGLTILARHVTGLVSARDERDPATALRLFPQRQGLAVTVFNPTHGPRTDHVTLQVPELLPHQTYCLFDEAGQAVPLAPGDWQARRIANWTLNAQGMLDLMDQIKRGGLLSRALRDAALRLKERPARSGQASSFEAELDLTLAEMAQVGEPDMAAAFQFIADLRRRLDEGHITHWRVRAWSSAQASASFMAHAVPGFGYRVYRLEIVDRPPLERSQAAPRRSPPTGDRAIENEFFRVEVNSRDGTLTLHDQRTGLRFTGLNRLVDNGDCGDEYNHCPPAHDRVIDRPVSVPHIAVRDEGSTGQLLEVTLHYRLPHRLADNRRQRATRTLTIPVVCRVWLRPGVPRVDIETTVDNRAEDHRLRAMFPTPFHVEQALAEGQFDIIARPVAAPLDTADYVEQPVATAPQCAFVAVQAGEHGLVLANQGLPEYEAIRTQAGTTIALTLLRSVGWLSRDDLSCRPGYAGPGLPTPGAQCLGVQRFAYALIPFSGPLSAAAQLAHAFQAPLRAVVTQPGNGRLPAQLSFIQLEPGDLVISAIKPADDGDGWIVRFWNTTDRPAMAQLTTGFDIARAEQVDLLEDRPQPLSLREHRTVEVLVRGKQIVSLRLRIA